MTRMEWECAGINHLAWFVKLRHQGKDLYPLLKKWPSRISPESRRIPTTKGTSSRKDMMLHFGAFITESSGHLSEYLPYYRKRPEISGEIRTFRIRWRNLILRRQLADLAQKRRRLPRGHAQGQGVHHLGSHLGVRQLDHRGPRKGFSVPHPWQRFNNVAGSGTLITNLPASGCVEVACMVDRNGINPTRFGALPPQMAALCASNMSMFELGATAAIERSKEAAFTPSCLTRSRGHVQPGGDQKDDA